MIYLVDEREITTQINYVKDFGLLSGLEEIHTLNDYPTEELIKCEECRYWDDITAYCEKLNMTFEADEYCSKAKRLVSVYTD